MSVKGKEAPKSLDDLASLAADQAKEIEIDVPSADEELHFEGGPLDGKRMTARQAEQEDLALEQAAADKAAGKKPGETPDPATPAAEPAVAAEGGEPAETPAEAPAAASTEETPASEPKYTPDFKLKVYDQEKEFPEWAKPLCTSKESEDNLRQTLQKSEAFDALKPRHEATVKERDEARGYVQEHTMKAQNMVKMRDTNPHLFIKSMGISDDQILQIGVQLAKAKDDPTIATAIANQLSADQRTLDQEFSAQDQARQSQQVHRQTVDMVFAMPEVQAFRSRFEAVYGQGTFEATVHNTGALAYQREGYLHPQLVVQRVMQQFGNTLPQLNSPVPQPAAGPAPGGQPQGGPGPVSAPQIAQPQATPQSAAHGARPAPPQRPKTIPNVGRGSTVTPVRSKMRSLDDVQKRVEAELAR